MNPCPSFSPFGLPGPGGYLQIEGSSFPAYHFVVPAKAGTSPVIVKTPLVSSVPSRLDDAPWGTWPAHLADADPSRALLDRRVICDLLGFDESIHESVHRLARSKPSARSLTTTPLPPGWHPHAIKRQYQKPPHPTERSAGTPGPVPPTISEHSCPFVDKTFSS